MIQLLMPKLGLWRGTSERNIWRTTSVTLLQAELKEIYSVAGWPILLSVPIYILSDKNFCQMEILITKMQVSVLGLTSISFLSPLSTLSLSWIMKPGGGLFWAWFMPRLSHVKTSNRSQLNLHGTALSSLFKRCNQQARYFKQANKNQPTPTPTTISKQSRLCKLLFFPDKWQTWLRLA